MSELLTEGADAGADVDAPVDEPLAPAATDIVAPAEPVTPPALAPAPTIDFTDPEVVDFLDARARSIFESQMQPLVPLLEQILGGGGGDLPGDFGGELVDEFGQLNVGALTGLLQQRDEKMLGEIRGLVSSLAAPLMAAEQEKAMTEGEQRLLDVIADDIGRNGDLIPTFGETEEEKAAAAAADGQARKLVRQIAGQVYDQLAGRFGGHEAVVRQGLGPRLSTAAMEQAMTDVRSIVTTARNAGAAIERNRLATLGDGSDIEPGATTNGVQTVPPVRARSLSEGLTAVTARHAEAIRNGG
jgi:hypothetical protein